jgi:hypothetical protein
MGKNTLLAAQFSQDLEGGGDALTDALFGRVNTAYVFGVLVVKDWRNNIHAIEVIESEHYDVHAEDAMYAHLRELYRAEGIPFHAKIIFYVTKSPCKKCTENMIDQVFGLYSDIAKNHLLYFSFVFKDYYLKSRSSESNKAQHLAWDSDREAQQAYDQVEADADRQGQSAFGVTGMITIRHVSATKGGGGQHRPIAFGYGTFD